MINTPPVNHKISIKYFLIYKLIEYFFKCYNEILLTYTNVTIDSRFDQDSIEVLIA